MKTALYYIRTRCNYSQSMAAKEIGVSRQMFSAWEQGKKQLPEKRKEMLAALFGVPAEILETENMDTVQAFCDRPMFSHVCQGKQVFSFLPHREVQRVFLGTPTEVRPEDRCHELMARKSAIMEHLNDLFSFDPMQQADQLPDMELKISLLASFAEMLDLSEGVVPQYRGRLLRFLLEQAGMLTAMLRGDAWKQQDIWSQQQLQLLRYRWGQQNRISEYPHCSEGEPDEPTQIIDRIDYWYQQIKNKGADPSEIQWKLNQLLEQEYQYESD